MTEFRLDTFRGRSELDLDVGSKSSSLSRLDLETTLSHDDEQQVSLNDFTSKHERNSGSFTILAFINSASGGGKGEVIYADLVKQLGKQYVFDLKTCKPGHYPEDIILPFALDPCVRILACGGDGTMGWIESSIDKVWAKIVGNGVPVETTKYKDYLPLAMMPLGTGNDLARTFGWGGSYKESMRKPRTMTKIEQASVVSLDRWRLLVLPLERLDIEARAWVPTMLGERDITKNRSESVARLSEMFSVPSSNSTDIDSSENISQAFDGVFCNYFSIGSGAEVAFDFHKQRQEHPARFKNQTMNKVAYVKSAQRVARKAPLLFDLVQVLVSQQGELVDLSVPKNCKSIVLINIPNVAGGFKVADCIPDDGLIEVIFLPSLPVALVSFSPLVPCARIKIAARTNKVVIRTKEDLHCQVDGEPWRQSAGTILQVSHFSRNAMLKKPKRVKGMKCICTSEQ